MCATHLVADADTNADTQCEWAQSSVTYKFSCLPSGDWQLEDVTLIKNTYSSTPYVGTFFPLKCFLVYLHLIFRLLLTEPFLLNKV